jgi:hypothetical protein
VIKRKDQEIQQLRAQNEQMRAQLGGTEVRRKHQTPDDDRFKHGRHPGNCKLACCRACVAVFGGTDGRALRMK